MHSGMFVVTSERRSRVPEWQTSCKKFLARNYGGGPGVTEESMADGNGGGGAGAFLFREDLMYYR